MKKTFTLSFYEMDRAYGGPEEGGWWYDTGRFERSFAIVRARSEDELYPRIRRLNNWLYRLQRAQRSTSSMAYSGGRFYVDAHEGTPPKNLPETRPHYE